MRIAFRPARIAVAAFLTWVAQAHAAPAIGGCPVLPENNYWNTPVDALPVHPSSQAWVNSIGAAANLHPDWGNVLADNYGIPYAAVAGSQARVPTVNGVSASKAITRQAFATPASVCN